MVELKRDIEASLRREGIDATVIGRRRHLYSIYSKMKTQHTSFKDIMDVFGFRVIVDRVDTCYRALGVVHNLYKPVPNRFKDYIAIPKANGYQSLHTGLVGMHGVPIEVQIRTRQMDMIADNGIAGHWLYTGEDDVNGSQVRARQWVAGLLDLQQRAGNSLEFIESLKIDLFPDEVYVFSPRGEIFELPKGACPVDFAYAVHTDIGNHCVACRVDRALAPLSVSLESGQTVEIITAADGRPSPELAGVRRLQQGPCRDPPGFEGSATMGVGALRTPPARPFSGQRWHLHQGARLPAAAQGVHALWRTQARRSAWPRSAWAT